MGLKAAVWTSCSASCLDGALNVKVVLTSLLYVVRCFFFASRRRHTRFDCDWSSDVCSSDLNVWPKKVLLLSEPSTMRELSVPRWPAKLMSPPRTSVVTPGVRSVKLMKLRPRSEERV